MFTWSFSKYSPPPSWMHFLQRYCHSSNEHKMQAILCQVLENRLTFLEHCFRGLKSPTGEELPEQLKFQGLSDQQLRRPPADPARCPGPTRAVDFEQTTTTKTMTATKTCRRLRAGSLLLTFMWLLTVFTHKCLLLGVFTSLKFSLRHHSCFAVIESGEGNQNSWLRDEKELTLSLIRIPSRRTTTLDEFWIWISIHTIVLSRSLSRPSMVVAKVTTLGNWS